MSQRQGGCASFVTRCRERYHLSLLARAGQAMKSCRGGSSWQWRAAYRPEPGRLTRSSSTSQSSSQPSSVASATQSSCSGFRSLTLRVALQFQQVTRWPVLDLCLTSSRTRQSGQYAKAMAVIPQDDFRVGGSQSSSLTSAQSSSYDMSYAQSKSRGSMPITSTLVSQCGQSSFCPTQGSSGGSSRHNLDSMRWAMLCFPSFHGS
jgi:hypothetical protein